VRSTARSRLVALGLGVALAIWFGLGALTAFVVTRPAPGRVPALERIENRAVESLELRARDGVRTVAWFVDGGRDQCAILLSGIHSSRRAALPRASFWLNRGWSVLMPDLRGTGESDVRPISFGWNERLDVAAWVAYLRERGLHTIALHGHSLGAAAAVYAVADGTQVELLVLDACYDDVRNALSRRLPFVPWPDFSFLPVRLFTQMRVDASLDPMRPVECLRRIHTPTFMALGALDHVVGGAAVESMLAASAAKHKQLHWVAHARHEELWLRDPADLGRALGEFMQGAGLP
jgi:fermentation-respiration switch protein FrsA (DUF1100 family)